MPSMDAFLKEWPKTEYGKQFLEDIALKIPDPALFFYQHPDDDELLKVLGLPRSAVLDIARDLLGADAPISQMIGRASDVFYWALYASPEEVLLLAFVSSPAKKRMS